MKHTFLLGMCLWLTACSSVPVETDFNPTAPFNSYQRYHWQSETSGGDRSVSPFHVERVRNQLQTLLQQQRYQEAGRTEKPDFLLRYYLSEQIEGHGRGRNTRGSVGLGSGRGGFGLGVSVGFPLGSNHPERKLRVIVDILDGHSKQLSWRGIAVVDADDSPEKVGEAIESAVSAIWAKYPPGR
ncbi:DUF4136 domain-containing protein [Litorivivens sp.]|uniref:DUF4136 domain-containing protein n=1 Tax=Litorivivens sp. TaxID=2020868 RepID=UPI00356758FF